MPSSFFINVSMCKDEYTQFSPLKSCNNNKKSIKKIVMTNEPTIKLTTKKELYAIMESLKKWHSQGIQLNMLQRSLPERAAEVSSLREQLSSQMRRGDAEIILMCGVNNQCDHTHLVEKSQSLASAWLLDKDAERLSPWLKLLLYPVSLYTFILEQQPRVKNSSIVSTLSYLAHQISNVCNFWPIVGPQEMPGGRCMCF